MRTSNINLLAEIDTLEEVMRKDSSELEVVKRIEELEAWQKKSLEAHPNIDMDIEALTA